MDPNVSKHSPDDEMSLSTDVFKFLQQDHNLLTQFGKKIYCEVCTKAFSEEKDLHYHRLDHIIDKPLVICDDDSLEESMSKKCMAPEDNTKCLTDEKIFTCEKCRKDFSTISCLRIHQKFFHLEYNPTSACDKCGSHFKWKHHLAVHRYADSSEKTSLCNTCNIGILKESCASDGCDSKTSIKKDLNALDSSHNQEPNIVIRKKHICHLCHREFTLGGNLSRHLLLIHKRKTLLTSKYCEKQYSKKPKVNNVKIHAKKTSFTCNICKKAFTHEGFLNRHLRCHSERRVFCKICHKGFFDRVELKQHVAVHSDEKAFVCQSCSKRFENQNDLNYHLQNHSDEKPYSCDFCEKRFIRKRCLATHINSHTGEKAVACHLCCKIFECQNDLNCHLQIHADEKPYPCDFCEKRFIRKRCLATHVMRFHPDQRPA